MWDLKFKSSNDSFSKVKLANVFKTKTRSEWVEIFDGSDACVTPVLELHEAPEHPHNKARKSFVKNYAGDMMAPIPAPRLSRPPAIANVSVPEPEMGANTDEILSEFGYGQEDIEKMKIEGTVQQTDDTRKSKLWNLDYLFMIILVTFININKFHQKNVFRSFEKYK